MLRAPIVNGSEVSLVLSKLTLSILLNHFIPYTLFILFLLDIFLQVHL